MTSVLLVDDQPAIRVGLRTILESAGLTVVAEAGDGDEAIQYGLASSGPDRPPSTLPSPRHPAA